MNFYFSVLGSSEEIICDNGTQFTSKVDKEFTHKWEFTITTSSPHFPRDHGFIERQVQIIKKFFNRCDEDGTNHQVALQELRTTPLDSSKPSPTQLLHSRKMKTTLPATIKPPWNSEVVRASLQSGQDFHRYDTQAKERYTLLTTQPVWIQDPTSHRWSQGVVQSKDETPRSYIVETPQGE